MFFIELNNKFTIRTIFRFYKVLKIVYKDSNKKIIIQCYIFKLRQINYLFYKYLIDFEIYIHYIAFDKINQYFVFKNKLNNKFRILLIFI